MPDSTSVRQIKVGRIVGLSSYELAVKNGTFTGTEQDFAKMVVTNQSEFDSIKARLVELEYVKIAISSFTSSVTVAEMGSSTNNIVLSWNLNKTPKTLKIDNDTLTATKTGTRTITTPVTATKSWKLTATDEKNATATATATLNVYNGVYYGVAASRSAYDSAFVKSLASKTLTGSKGRTITLSIGANQYAYYCVPSRLGTCNFNVGGFDGGFSKVATISFTNPSNYTENYDIYRSDNANLGSTRIVVS